MYAYYWWCTVIQKEVFLSVELSLGDRRQVGSVRGGVQTEGGGRAYSF